MRIVEDCPFCGASDTHLKTDEQGSNLHSKVDHWVYCSVCNARGPTASSKQLAVEEWEFRS